LCLDIVVANQTTATSTSKPKESNLVLAKPVQESDAQNDLPDRYPSEAVGNKPESVVKAQEEDEERNKNAMNFENKFNDMQEALGHDTNDGNIMEPNLINSLGDDEETAPLNKNPRFNPRSMAKDVADANLPEDPDTEMDDDRIDN